MLWGYYIRRTQYSKYFLGSLVARTNFVEPLVFSYGFGTVRLSLTPLFHSFPYFDSCCPTFHLLQLCTRCSPPFYIAINLGFIRGIIRKYHKMLFSGAFFHMHRNILGAVHLDLLFAHWPVHRNLLVRPLDDVDWICGMPYAYCVLCNEESRSIVHHVNLRLSWHNPCLLILCGWLPINRCSIMLTAAIFVITPYMAHLID